MANGSLREAVPLMEGAPRATRLQLNVLEQPMNVAAVVSRRSFVRCPEKQRKSTD